VTEPPWNDGHRFCCVSLFGCGRQRLEARARQADCVRPLQVTIATYLGAGVGMIFELDRNRHKRQAPSFIGYRRQSLIEEVHVKGLREVSGAIGYYA
jgi:hypothetical protein